MRRSQSRDGETQEKENGRRHSPAEGRDQDAGPQDTVHGDTEFGRESRIQPLAGLQRSRGNQAVQRLVTERSQRRQELDNPGDRHRQESEQVSEQGRETPHESAVSTGRPPAAASTSGRPLDPSTRREMEAKFGADFSHVRLHTDVSAQQRVMVADSAAITHGAHIYVGPQYHRGSSRKRALLAHELTHVVQQSPGGRSEKPRGRAALEREAQAVGRRVATGADAGSVSAGSAPQRVPQADAAGELALHFRGKAGERGIGVLYVEGWSRLTPAEQESIRAFGRQTDAASSTDRLMRQLVTPQMRTLANQTARVARGLLNLPSSAAAGHLPDVAAGQAPIAPIAGMPSRVNNSFGGQWKRYAHGFTFTGLSIYDADTGQWIYSSQALEHEPPPAPKGRPTPKAGTPASVSRTKPMRKPAGGGPRTGVTATSKTVTSHRLSNPEVSTSTASSSLGTPEFSATPEQRLAKTTTTGPSQSVTTAPASATRPLRPARLEATPSATTPSGATLGKTVQTTPSSGTLTRGGVTVDYNLRHSDPQSSIRLKSIDLSEYPPDREGPVTRVFSDRPVLRLASGTGVASTSSTAGSTGGAGEA